jgi:deoxyxylulose-5-phosphate synthase
MIGHIMLLDEKQVTETLHEILREFARRHRNITQTFTSIVEINLIEELGINYNGLSDERKNLSVLTAPWNMLESSFNFHCRRF